jgi:hypothetical protein
MDADPAHQHPDADDESLDPIDPQFVALAHAVAHAVAILHFDAVADGFECRVYDPLGRCVATLVGDFDRDRHPRFAGNYDPEAFDFTVRYVRAGAGGVLPVRPQPDSDSYAPPLTHSVSQSHGPDGALLATTHTVTHTVTHSHGHRHKHPDADREPLTDARQVVYRHVHPHAHRDERAYRGGIYGHADDPHDDHQHDDGRSHGWWAPSLPDPPGEPA